MVATAPQLHRISTSERRTISVDFSGSLDDGDTLTGTPTVTADDALTITNEQVSTGTLVLNGVSLSAGLAVQFKVDASGATAGSTYTLTIVCNTTSGDETEGRIDIKVI